MTRSPIPTLVAAVAVAFAGADSYAWASEPARYEIQADVRPAPSAAGTYVCTTTVRDAATRQILASPRLRFERGGAVAKARLTDVPPGTILEIRVAISEAKEAEYEARVTRDGAVQMVSRVTFVLADGE